MHDSLKDVLNKYNDFNNICKNSSKNLNGLTDFLKVITSNGGSDVYNGKGNRLSFKNEKEIYNEMCIRT